MKRRFSGHSTPQRHMRTTILQNESIMTLTFPRLTLTRAAALALAPLAAVGLAATASPPRTTTLAAVQPT